MTVAPGGSPIRVLVVDDSPLVRDVVSAILAEDPEIAVAGQAANGLEAVARTASLDPDIVIMDIEMPVMNGLDAIETIMARAPRPILVLTSHTGVRVAFAAVSRGALDVMEKPDLDMEHGVKLLRKVKLLARVDIAAHQKAVGAAPPPPQPQRSSVAPAAAGTPAPAGPAPAAATGGPDLRIVAIAASTGGPKALEQILSRLPAGFPLPVVVSQHIADGFTPGMAEWLNGLSPLAVAPARHGDRLRPGHVYFNPSEQSMEVTSLGTALLRPGDPKSFYHPCCNDMLRSVAAAYRRQALAVILTGMGDDGVDGMRAVKAAGGTTLAQDEKTSIVYGMNGLAVKQGCIDQVLPLADIPGRLVRLAGTRS